MPSQKLSPKHKVLSRCEITDLIAEGKAIVIYKNYVLDLSGWLKKHPGGELPVYHMVGRDATDEMNAYHSEETMQVFTKWKVGIIDYHWENLLPPIQGGLYQKTLDNGSDSDYLGDTLISEKEFKGAGYPKIEKLEPIIPQNVIITPENKDNIYPVEDKEVIVDPQLLMREYDNKLSRKDLEEVPDLDYKTQEFLKEKYNELHDVIIKNGFYDCNYWNYGREFVKIGSLFLYSFLFMKMGYLFLSAIFMGVAWQQGAFIVHDAGHVSITHNYQLDNIFGMLVADWFGGLSLGWWKRNHNVHHVITNDPIHDPDIQHLPFFAVSTRLFGNVYLTFYERYLWMDKAAQLLIPIQKFMYYPILCFGRFNLYRLSWMHLILGLGPRKGKAAWFRYFEIAGISFFFYWFFYLVVHKSIEGTGNKVMYVLVSHIATMLVHVQITLSHFAMSTADLGVSESFPSRQIRTTMDVDCPEWLDWLHGGLQFQAIHHLFPRLPRHNLRRVQPLVIQFCKEVGLKYYIYGFGEEMELL